MNRAWPDVVAAARCADPAIDPEVFHRPQSVQQARQQGVVLKRLGRATG